MSGVKGVVRAFRSFGKTGQAAQSPERIKTVAPAGEQLVSVRLVAHVPDQAVPGGVEHPVNGDGQFHHAQGGSQVPSGPGHGPDDLLPDFLSQTGQVLDGQLAEVGW